MTAVLLLLARFTSWMYRDLGREIMATSGNDDTGWLDADDELLVATATHTSAGLNTGGLDEGADIVGVLVLSWVAVSRIAGARRKKSGKAFVRGWAVRPDAQGKGIGRALLKEVVKVCVRERGAEGVWFADDFARELAIPSIDGPIQPTSTNAPTQTLNGPFIFSTTAHSDDGTSTPARRSLQ